MEDLSTEERKGRKEERIRLHPFPSTSVVFIHGSYILSYHFLFVCFLFDYVAQTSLESQLLPLIYVMISVLIADSKVDHL